METPIEKIEELSEDIFNPGVNISTFKSIAFSLFSSDEIRKISVVEITESKLTGEGSIYDERMGVIQNHTLCVTCGKNNAKCTGHFGRIEIPPIPHPMYTNEILTYLEMFCSECSSLLVTVKEMRLLNMFKLKGINRLNAIFDFTSKVKCCPKCNKDKYSFNVNSDNKFYKFLDDKNDSVQVSSIEIENILGNISKDDIKRLGFFNDEVEPIRFIMTVLLVLPICARPFVETSKGLCDDDLTSKYIEIIKIVNKLKSKTKPLKEKDKQDAIDSLDFHIRTLMDNKKAKARQINGRPVKCLRERMNGKTGLFRGNLSGKRGDFTGRSVISNDPLVRVDEIAIPVEFAEKETYPEKVFKLNKDKLEKMVNNDQANYVIRNGKNIDLKIYFNIKMFYESEGFNLEDTDIVIRDDKKINLITYKERMGKNLILLPTDKVVRNNRILKNIKLAEKVLFELEPNDKVMRNGTIIPHNKAYSYNENNIKKFELKPEDKVFRKNKELKNITISPKRYFQLKIGDVVERQLLDGDIVLYGRQPTLHKGSIIARKIKIFHNKTGINGHRPILTIRMNPAICKTYNADFDGD